MPNYSQQRLIKAQIIPVKDGIEQTEYGELTYFFLNPSSWSDTKDPGWVKVNIPGRSEPHQQWVGGGARTVTFEALVTNDRASGEMSDKNQFGFKTPTINKVSVIKKIGGIAAQAFNIPELSLTSSVEAQGRGTSSASLNLDVSSKLNFYRSFVYPSALNESGRLQSVPFYARLKVGSTLGRRTQSSTFVVERVDITITKQLPDLTPIEARVSFTLTEISDNIIAAESNILTDI